MGLGKVGDRFGGVAAAHPAPLPEDGPPFIAPKDPSRESVDDLIECGVRIRVQCTEIGGLLGRNRQVVKQPEDRRGQLPCLGEREKAAARMAGTSPWGGRGVLLPGGLPID